jgi:pyrroline-5-carboxylate reductase
MVARDQLRWLSIDHRAGFVLSLVDGVSSPGGTTIAAIERLEAGGLRAAFADAVSASVRRAEELGS